MLKPETMEVLKENGYNSLNLLKSIIKMANSKF
jgi:hypothetical protein